MKILTRPLDHSTTQPLLLLLALLSLSFAAAPPTDSLCDRAEYLFFNRHQNRTWLDSAYRLLEAAHRADPRHERCMYLWSRIHIQKGDDAANKNAKLWLFGQSRAIAESLIAVNELNPLGHTWWAVAHGRVGQTRGVLNSLFMVPALRKAVNRAVELDPKQPTALDVLGVLHYELPGFAGGDLYKSEQYLLRGIEADPDYTLLRLDLAKVYVKQKRWLGARTQLERLLATKNPTYPADFWLDDKPEAEALLQEIRDR
jgi:hypothetical protein